MLGLLPAFVTALVLSALGVGLVLGWLARVQILDHPNERSSHAHPTPRGGGLGVVPAILLAWALFAGPFAWQVAAGALALGLLSWIDDARGLSPLHRLIAQVAVCAWVVASTPLPAVAFIPTGILPVLALLALVWFVNLYNFMDGIDGITGVESAAIAIGIAVVEGVGVEGLGPQDKGMIAASLTVAGAGLGFLIWNWHPAKIFMGDSGSVPLGVILGGLLLRLAAQGHWAEAAILPAYYGADATITLCRRLLAGEKVWQAHRKHFYQRATRGTTHGSHSHAQVSLAILAGNLGLIGAAVVAATVGIAWGLALGAAVTAGLLGVLAYWAEGAPA